MDFGRRTPRGASRGLTTHSKRINKNFIFIFNTCDVNVHVICVLRGWYSLHSEVE